MQATVGHAPGGEAVRVGVVGCGYWGAKHVRVLHANPDVRQVIAIDQRQERLSSLEQAFRGLITYPDLESALDQLDAVIIATPATTHASLALQALASGKSVLVEKPLATSNPDAQRVIEEAEARSLVLMVGHTFEYNAAVRKLREVVQGGELGRVYYLDSARLNLGLYQSDVNVIWDLGPHDVSIFNYILGAAPASVQAWGSHHGHYRLEDVAYLRLLYSEPEVTATIHVSWLYPAKVRRTTVVGSQKMAVYNDLDSEERIRIFDKGLVGPEDTASPQNMPMSYRYGEIRAPYLFFEEPLELQDREFISCVLTGRQPATNGENGLRVVQTLECANLSLQTGQPVPLDELDRHPSATAQLAKIP
jgi:predicted dehydrogenase